jgi:hypothetical protein
VLRLAGLTAFRAQDNRLHGKQEHGGEDQEAAEKRKGESDQGGNHTFELSKRCARERTVSTVFLLTGLPSSALVPAFGEVAEWSKAPLC